MKARLSSELCAGLLIGKPALIRMNALSNRSHKEERV
jgi:hypothetical protein